MQIRINKVECGHCNKLFYEIEDYEVNACPHCDEIFGLPLSFLKLVVGIQIAEVEIDHETGELRFAGGKAKDPA